MQNFIFHFKKRHMPYYNIERVLAQRSCNTISVDTFSWLKFGIHKNATYWVKTTGNNKTNNLSSDKVSELHLGFVKANYTLERYRQYDMYKQVVAWVTECCGCDQESRIDL